MEEKIVEHNDAPAGRSTDHPNVKAGTGANSSSPAVPNLASKALKIATIEKKLNSMKKSNPALASRIN